MDSSIHAIQSYPFPVTLFVGLPSPLKFPRLEQDFYTSLEFSVTVQDPNNKPDSNSGISYIHTYIHTLSLRISGYGQWNSIAVVEGQ